MHSIKKPSDIFPGAASVKNQTASAAQVIPHQVMISLGSLKRNIISSAAGTKFNRYIVLHIAVSQLLMARASRMFDKPPLSPIPVPQSSDAEFHWAAVTKQTVMQANNQVRPIIAIYVPWLCAFCFEAKMRKLRSLSAAQSKLPSARSVAVMMVV